VSDYPHVTDIIALVRNFDFTPEAALERGRHVHAATALMDGAGDGSGLDWDSLHPVLVPYCEAWAAWTEIYRPAWTFIEQRIVVNKYRYQGRPDRVSLPGHLIVDIKCGPVHPSYGLQLAAYERGHRIQLERLSVHLYPNGRFKVEEWKDRADWPVFLGLLQIHQWRVRHGFVAESRDTSDRGI